LGYREVVMSQNPLSFWPLDDDTTLGIAREATGSGNNGAYTGSIFNKAIPLVANGIYGTRLTDATASIYYPLPGAVGSGQSWTDGSIWTKGKSNQSFSIELYFKLNEDSISVDDELVLFGNKALLQSSQGSAIQTYTDLIDDYQTYAQVLAAFDTYDEILNATILAPYGIYVYRNKIYFRPDPLTNYYVSYQVPDWKRRYHVVANYSSNGISLIVNGNNISTKSSSSLTEIFQFTQNPGVMKTYGSDNYDITVDAIALYSYNFDIVRSIDHLSLSRKVVLKDRYYNANSQVVYIPNNNDCLIAYKFINNWTDFNFTNSLVNTSNQLTMRYLSNAEVTGGTGTQSVTDARNGLTLGAGAYVDVSNVIRLSERGTALSMSFYHTSSSPEKALMSLYNFQSSQSFSAIINSSDDLVFTLNGNQTATTFSPLAGWNEILVENTVGSFNVYLNGSSVFSSTDYMQTITNAYIGKVNDSYAVCPITWVAIKSGIQYEPLTIHRLYNEESTFILKMNNNLKWSQYGKVEGLITLPAVDYSGSLAFYTTSSPNVSVTYNNGLIWPRMASMPTLVDNPSNQVTEYNITVSLFTNDSEEDLPIVSNLGLYAYTQGMKRVVSDNTNEAGVIVNPDNCVIFDDDLEMLDRLDQSGIRLAGNSYLKIPSQSRNYDSSGFNGTKSISIVFKLNGSLPTNGYILKSGTKSLYWDGTAWQYPGFTKMYVNGKESFDNQAMINDWVHVVLTSGSKINAANDIYIGSDDTGANQTDITLGLFAMAAYTLDAFDAETEYEVLVGYPQESLALEQVSFNVIDYGLTPYKVAWQRA